MKTREQPGNMPQIESSQSVAERPAHTVRASLASPERTFWVERQTLCWEDGKGGGTLPLDALTSLRLSSYPGVNAPAKQCVLKSRKHPRVLIRSAHYRSFGMFEDRSATYASVVRLIIERSAATDSPPRYLAGNRGLWFAWLAIFLLGLVAMLPSVGWVLANADAPFGHWLALAGLAALTCVAWRQVRLDNGKPFDPAQPPEALLR